MTASHAIANPQQPHASNNAPYAPIGVCLEPEAIYTAIPTQDQANDNPRWIQGAGAIPPSVLLPTFPGEPIAVQTHLPIDPRGAGDVWPPIARTHPDRRSARFPIAYAWPMLRHATPWTYRQGDFQDTVQPQDALAHAVHATLATTELSQSAALVTPANLTARTLELLATAMRGRATLIARPLAAAQCLLQAAQTQSAESQPLNAFIPQSDSSTNILTLHLGLTEWEARVVRVAPGDGGAWQLALETDQAIPEPPGSYGLDLLGRLAARSLEMSYRTAAPTRIWELLWSTPWMTTVIDRLSNASQTMPPASLALSAHALSTEFLRQQWRQATQQILSGAPSSTGFIVTDLPPSPRLEDLRDWVNALRACLEKTDIAAAVVTGAMAAIVDRQLGVFGEHYARRIVPGLQVIAIEAAHLPRGAPASAAAQLLH